MFYRYIFEQYVCGMEDLPLFSNTCGKIYDDNVIFAFTNGEKKIVTKKITSIKFGGRITARSLGILFLPFPALMLIHLEKDLNSLLRIAGFAAMFGIFAVALYYAEKKYSISLNMNDGSKLTISVSKNNKSDAKKFVEKLKKKC